MTTPPYDPTTSALGAQEGRPPLASPPGLLMEREIADQPDVLAGLLADTDDIRRVASRVHALAPGAVMIVARGSSDHAALYLKYLLEVHLGLPTGLCSPSSTTLYGAAPFSPGTLVVGISQSGGSTDLVTTLAAARGAGALTLAMTNDAGSPLAAAAELHLDLRAGTERSVAATKTYTAELLVAALLVDAVARAGGRPGLAGLQDVPGAARAMLDIRPEILRAVRDGRALRDPRHLVVTARGYNHATAREGALKIMETCYVPALAFSAADLRHGPFALLDATVPSIVLLGSGAQDDPATEAVQQIVATGSPTITYGSGPRPDGVEHHVTRPHDLPAPLAPIVDVVALQYLALELSRALGLDADAPRALRKVTVTV